jgi:hypothetical protein
MSYLSSIQQGYEDSLMCSESHNSWILSDAICQCTVGNWKYCIKPTKDLYGKPTGEFDLWEQLNMHPWTHGWELAGPAPEGVTTGSELLSYFWDKKKS